VKPAVRANIARIRVTGKVRKRKQRRTHPLRNGVKRVRADIARIRVAGKVRKRKQRKAQVVVARKGRIHAEAR